MEPQNAAIDPYVVLIRQFTTLQEQAKNMGLTIITSSSDFEIHRESDYLYASTLNNIQTFLSGYSACYEDIKKVSTMLPPTNIDKREDL